MPIDALSVLCAQLTRDLFAIAKFLFHLEMKLKSVSYTNIFILQTCFTNQTITVECKLNKLCG